ncbi:hypothetical protein BDY19DRAFT_988465 [Irpex rosettiformis]|uniref:Uncharacterized protein n=1 Tax=Irpex rosettiformis TaxID=378272 RepID=A0ACB8UJT6_9APHY|nr:hypothetical protein BDY19DRAFT_988465 [Irpex rosettiformis]
MERARVRLEKRPKDNAQRWIVLRWRAEAEEVVLAEKVLIEVVVDKWSQENVFVPDSDSTEELPRRVMALQELNSPWSEKGLKDELVNHGHCDQCDIAFVSCSPISSIDTDDAAVAWPSPVIDLPEKVVSYASQLPIRPGMFVASVGARICSVGIRSDRLMFSSPWLPLFVATIRSLASSEDVPLNNIYELD